ncbi:MAG: uracil-DNA glycosylase [Clostridiales bacterium]|nr:uracil-DNA glycosylase [Clostridiales bacterium]
MVNIGNSWDEVLKGEFYKDYYLKLRGFLKSEYSSRVIYPDMYHIFNALKFTPYERVKAVIIGQDPYHQPGQAHGLCFSVQKGVPKPPSLLNIFKELNSDLGIEPPNHGNLESWANSGVLLLNAVLTVRQNQANSHKGKGWEIFTDRVIELLNERKEPMVFILWGANAKAKTALITNPQHCIIKGAHPSPLSAHNGFWDGKYFSRTNEFLKFTGQEPIDWRIPE